MEPVFRERVMRKVHKNGFQPAFCILFVLLLSLVVLPVPGYGLVVGETDTSDFTDNTSKWNGMNWDYVYATGSGTSVAIDGWHLISASHYSLNVGLTFTVGSDTFEIVSSTLPPPDDGESVRPDLRIIEVQNLTRPGIPLPGSYDLYEGTFTRYQETILVGTGHTGVSYSSSYSDDTSSARLERWGTNKVETFSGSTTTGQKGVDGNGDGKYDWLTWSFRMEYSVTSTEYEVGLADHDSGCGVFVLDAGEWKLAGIGLYRSETYYGSDKFDYNFAAAIPYYVDWIESQLPVFLLGDANWDGVVSAADYAAVQAYFGNVGGAGLWGDANGDGVVSAADYAAVQANFGHTIGSSVDTLLPEPATISLLCLGAISILRRKRK